MPWQGLKNLILRWSRGPWIRGEYISNGHAIIVTMEHRVTVWQWSTSPGRSYQEFISTQADANSFSFGLLLIPFLRASLHPSLSPTSWISPFTSERLCLPLLSWAQNTLCLCMKACLAHSVLSRRPKQAFSGEWAASMCWHSWNPFKGSEDFISCR